MNENFLGQDTPNTSFSSNASDNTHQSKSPAKLPVNTPSNASFKQLSPQEKLNQVEKASHQFVQNILLPILTQKKSGDSQQFSIGDNKTGTFAGGRRCKDDLFPSDTSEAPDNTADQLDPKFAEMLAFTSRPMRGKYREGTYGWNGPSSSSIAASELILRIAAAKKFDATGTSLSELPENMTVGEALAKLQFSNALKSKNLQRSESTEDIFRSAKSKSRSRRQAVQKNKVELAEEKITQLIDDVVTRARVPLVQKTDIGKPIADQDLLTQQSQNNAHVKTTFLQYQQSLKAVDQDVETYQQHVNQLTQQGNFVDVKTHFKRVIKTERARIFEENLDKRPEDYEEQMEVFRQNQRMRQNQRRIKLEKMNSTKLNSEIQTPEKTNVVEKNQNEQEQPSQPCEEPTMSQNLQVSKVEMNNQESQQQKLDQKMEVQQPKQPSRRGRKRKTNDNPQTQTINYQQHQFEVPIGPQSQDQDGNNGQDRNMLEHVQQSSTHHMPPQNLPEEIQKTSQPPLTQCESVIESKMLPQSMMINEHCNIAPTTSFHNFETAINDVPQVYSQEQLQNSVDEPVHNNEYQESIHSYSHENYFHAPDVIYEQQQFFQPSQGSFETSSNDFQQFYQENMHFEKPGTSNYEYIPSAHWTIQTKPEVDAVKEDEPKKSPLPVVSLEDGKMYLPGAIDYGCVQYGDFIVSRAPLTNLIPPDPSRPHPNDSLPLTFNRIGQPIYDVPMALNWKTGDTFPVASIKFVPAPPVPKSSIEETIEEIVQKTKTLPQQKKRKKKRSKFLKVGLKGKLKDVAQKKLQNGKAGVKEKDKRIMRPHNKNHSSLGVSVGAKDGKMIIDLREKKLVSPEVKPMSSVLSPPRQPTETHEVKNNNECEAVSTSKNTSQTLVMKKLEDLKNADNLEFEELIKPDKTESKKTVWRRIFDSSNDGTKKIENALEKHGMQLLKITVNNKSEDETLKVSMGNDKVENFLTEAASKIRSKISRILEEKARADLRKAKQKELKRYSLKNVPIQLDSDQKIEVPRILLNNRFLLRKVINNSAIKELTNESRKGLAKFLPYTTTKMGSLRAAHDAFKIKKSFENEPGMDKLFRELRCGAANAKRKSTEQLKESEDWKRTMNIFSIHKRRRQKIALAEKLLANRMRVLKKINKTKKRRSKCKGRKNRKRVSKETKALQKRMIRQRYLRKRANRRTLMMMNDHLQTRQRRYMKLGENCDVAPKPLSNVLTENIYKATVIPEFASDLDIYQPTKVRTVKEMMKRHKRLKKLYPNCMGLDTSESKLSEICHSVGIGGQYDRISKQIKDLRKELKQQIVIDPYAGIADRERRLYEKSIGIYVDPLAKPKKEDKPKNKKPASSKPKNPPKPKLNPSKPNLNPAKPKLKTNKKPSNLSL